MYKKIDLNTWSRREHFDFFRSLDYPYWGTVQTINVEHLKSACQKHNVSLYAGYLHTILLTMNQLDAFRYRIVASDVYLYDHIDISPTVLREDKSFGFSRIAYTPSLIEFAQRLAHHHIETEQTKGLYDTFSEGAANTAHFSALPWIHFSDISHAHNITGGEGIPRLSIGKIVDGKMPVAIEVHHGFVDGYHVGQFYEQLQANIDAL